MNTILSRAYNDLTVYFNESGYLNATPIARKFGREARHFLELQSTLEYIEALQSHLQDVDYKDTAGIPRFNSELSTDNVIPLAPRLVMVRQGSPAYGGGTWLHPKLAIPFARWCDAKFAIWCDAQIETILKPNNEQPNNHVSTLDAMLSDVAKQSAKSYAEAYLKASGQPTEYIDYLLNLAEEQSPMAAKRANLFQAKPTTAPATPAAPIEEAPQLLKKPTYREGTRMVGAHINDAAYKQLRLLSIEEGVTSQKLLAEALNLLFTSRGKLPIA